MRAVSMTPSSSMHPDKMRGNAIAEVVGALLAITPFIIGMPLLGKQFDVKHKALDAARYAVWERTVWRNEGASNRKDETQIELEARDRILGHPSVGVTDARSLAEVGVSENPLWRGANREPLVADADGNVPVSVESETRVTPIDVGYLLVPGLAYAHGAAKTVAAALDVSDLRLASRAFSNARVAVGLKNFLGRIPASREPGASQSDRDERGAPLAMTADAAILSDTWSVRDENSLRRRVDDLTTNELIESLEFAGQIVATQAPAKGKPLYGEGQFAAHPDLRPSSNALPAAYVSRK